MIGFKTARRDAVPIPSFHRQDMNAFAAEATKQEAARIRQGRNIEDQPAKPLTPGYARNKRAAGLPAIRNLTRTGALLQSRTVIKSGENSAEVGFTDARQQQKAEANERIEPMLGVSPVDRVAVDRAVTRAFVRKVDDLNR